MYECQGQSLSCAISSDGINKVITTTAYVLTPIVAIIGFQSWKNQFNSKTISEIAKDCSKLLNETNSSYFSLMSSLQTSKINEGNVSYLKDLKNLVEICENNRLLTIINIEKLSKLTKNSELCVALDKWSEKCSASANEILNLAQNKHDINKRILVTISFGKHLITYKNLDEIITDYILV